MYFTNKRILKKRNFKALNALITVFERVTFYQLNSRILPRILKI